MNFKVYSKWNNIIGWLVFAISAFTYLSTIEHTVSLWDCGEFVSCSYKVQVPHPPGAPFFILIYRIATFLAGSNLKLVPIMCNSMSALCSAFGILFLFWTITALAVKVVIKDENNFSLSNLIAILGAGAVGALAYNFSDTYWFSAVEGEVYAMSSLFTALIFWVALKWERRANEKHALRWIILMFYLVGVVIGIHLLGLLVVPIVFLMYYYKKFKRTTNWGAILATFIGFVGLVIIQYFIIQYLLVFAGKFDLLFVNDFDMPIWSGVIFFICLIAAIIIYLIIWSHKRGKILLNTVMVSIAAIIIGYSSYATSVIRSYANPSIDMNDPQDIFSLIGYVSREQYGDNYLLTGPNYNVWTSEGGYSTEEGETQYRVWKGKFEEAGHKNNPVFNPQFTTFFPRMYHQEPDKVRGYRFWGGVTEAQEKSNRISFVKNNLQFFWRYQMNYMYWRYFLWNFVGRQNDVQGMFHEPMQGNWISGINFIDEPLAGVGPQKNLPYRYKANMGRNRLYGLPLILGILGMIFQWRRSRKDFLITFLFFFMTGLAIAIYLNMPSPQPRERDYAFVGSFYVFAIWIGLGVLYLWEALSKRINTQTAAIVSTGICLLAVPTLMAAEEWNDHDRSKRTATLDYASDYLNSCAQNAVLFTNGDNDTYPLWYAQEVEGIRSDVRIVNLSLFGTDWYINQMRTPINKAPGLAFSLTAAQTKGWDYLPYNPQYLGDENQFMDLKDVIHMVATDKPEYRRRYTESIILPFLPSKKIRMNIDSAAVVRSGTVSEQDVREGKVKIVKNIDIILKKNNVFKSDMMVLDFIMTNNWKNPVYFSITSGPDDYLGMTPYLKQEGLAYRLVPVKADGPATQEPRDYNVDEMYKNIMTKWTWGQLDVNHTYMDYVLERQAETIRGQMAMLCSELLRRGKKDSALKVAEKAEIVVPDRNVPYNYYNATFIKAYYAVGQKDKADKFAETLANRFTEELDYLRTLKPSMQPGARRDIQFAMYGLQTLIESTSQYNKTLHDKYDKQVKDYEQAFSSLFGQQQGPADEGE